jgi:hypothetical protein
MTIGVKYSGFFTVFLFSGLILFSVADVNGQRYEIARSTTDGGGGISSGGQYIVSGTIGQHDAAYSAGGDYELLGGFWSGEPLCTVDFYHYARFAEYWLQSGTGLPADLYEDGIVDSLDLELFVNEWLCYCPYDWPLK